MNVQIGAIYPYIPLTTPPQPTLLHSTPQDTPDRSERSDIADFMVLDRWAEDASERLCIVF